MSGFAASPATICVALAIAGLIAVFALLAVQRGDPRWRGWRLAAIAAAMVGLLGLVLRPWRAAPPAGDRAVLETAGAGSAAPGLRVKGGGSDRWQAVPDGRTLWRREPWLRRLEVRGYGLEAEEFDGFRGTIERFAPPALAPGVTTALWPRRLTLGAPLMVEARLAPATAGRLELEGPGGVEAGADAAPARRGVTLTSVPKATGRFLYHLVVRDAEHRERAREPLDVVVEPPRPPAVLALFGAPSFETQALLRWLTATGVPFVARLELSRDRAHVEALWPPALGAPPPASPLAAANLARFDVLLMDGRSFQALPLKERTVLTAALDGGLGLLLLDVDSAAGEQRGLALRTRALPGAPTREARLQWPGEEPLPALTVPGREIAPQAAAEPLISDLERHLMAARMPRGRGWIALSLIPDTFRLTLDNGPRDYGALWAYLLGAVARPDASPRFVLPAGPALVDRPFEVTLLSTGERPPRVEVVDGGRASRLPVFATGRSRFAARLWPRSEGWLRLAASDGATAWVYASGGRSWDTWRKAARIAATSARRAAPAERGLPAPSAPRSWPRLPLFALFLAGVGLLWLLERGSDTRAV